MPRIKLLFLLAFILASSLAGESRAQWQNLGLVPGPQPNRGAAAYFWNANEGVIGTGNFLNSYLARIYYTSDGGLTWVSSLMPNLTINGQVTDIWFKDRLNGWATVTESAFTGWSGVYRSTDGGKSWKLVRQSQSPVSVRENSRGVFFTDRGAGATGVIFSNDTGKTWSIVAANSAPLGIEFLNDKDGYVTSETGGSAPHMRTTNSGETWLPITSQYEAWGVVADPKSNTFVYASEKDGIEPETSGIDRVLPDGRTERKWNATAMSITGGIAGFVTACNSIMYVQGQGGVLKGFLRSMDGGVTWKEVGGPSNTHDTRFAVTGKGAVVYAFDRDGNIYRTMNGGDGQLYATVKQTLQIKAVQLARVESRECDSIVVPIELVLGQCDTAKVIEVEVLNDNFNEIIPLTQTTRAVGGSTRDTIRIRYVPQQLGTYVFRVRVALQHPDGYIEDTILSLNATGLPSAEIFTVTEQTAPKTIDFGKLNICSGDSIRTITLSNLGCGTLNVSDITIGASAFSFRSRVRPLALSPGDDRSYLIQFRPRALGPHSSWLVFHTRDGKDSIRLVGEGVPGQRGLALSQPVITSTVCDSVEARITIRNTSCGQVVLKNVTSSSPVNVISFTSATLLTDSTIELVIRFVPSTPGATQHQLTIDATIGSDDFDTTLTVNTTATEGDLVLTTSSNTLEFDSVSTCSQVTLPVWLRNDGCAAIVISGAVIDGTGTDFTIEQQVSDPNMLRGETDTIWVTFKPGSVGEFTGTLRIMTNAGERTITLHGYGREDRGAVVLAFNGTLQAELCTHQDFNVRIANGTCDDVTVDSIVILGDESDYIFPNLGQQGIKVGDAYDLFGQFAPTAAGARRITIRVYYTDPLGSYVKEIELTGIGTSAPPLFASLPADSVMQALILSDIQMPIYVNGLTNSEIQSVEFALALRTDLLTPIDMALDGTEMAGANVEQFAVANDSVTVRLTFPTPRRIGEGILSRVNFRTFVTDTLSTQIRLLRFSASGTQAKCLATSVQSVGQPPVFSLDPRCGEQYVSDFMGGRLPSIFSIRPNPSSGRVVLKLSSMNEASDASVSIYDATGRVVLEQSIPQRASEVRLDIPGGAGQYFVRLRSSLGSSTRSVVVRK